MRVIVGGFTHFAGEEIAPTVDSVLGGQLDRLAELFFESD